ncbi:unnamed protein product [Rhizoctonia solani]|nr:unnamed protein product [Rhizoctonia solani]
MIDAAYLFYYAVDVPTESVGDATFHKSQVHDVVHDTVIEASKVGILSHSPLLFTLILFKLGFDVITVATWMENQIFLRDLKFERGSGHLHYFLHNWRTAPMGDIDGDDFSSEAEPSVDAGQQVGLILV